MSEYFLKNKVAAAHYGITLSKHSEWKPLRAVITLCYSPFILALSQNSINKFT